MGRYTPAMPADLNRAILDYIDHISDKSYFDHVLKLASPDEIARAVVELTDSDDRVVVACATLFAEDGCRQMHHVKFRRRLIEAGLLDALRTNLTRPDYAIRRHAIVVIGRSFPAVLPDVAAILPLSLEDDPLLLDILLRESQRVSDEPDHSRWNVIGLMVQSPSYLTRWAAIDVAIETHRGKLDLGVPAIPRAKSVLRILVADSDVRVRTEARFRLRELEANEEGPALGPSARRWLQRIVAADKPDLTFGRVKQGFENCLWQERIADYDVALLDAWVRYYELHPQSYEGSRDLDCISSYYRRFTQIWRHRH
jgi:hypothetical protein